MENNFKGEVQLYMIFDRLNDVIRRGPLLWKVKRERLAEIKDHSFDLIIILKLIEKYWPLNINCNKIIDYMIFHDLPEAITGDITKFEGISEEEIKRVTDIAEDWLKKLFNDVVNIEEIFDNYKNKVDIESKIAHMIDKVHSAIEFIKYQSENNIDIDNPEIPHILRNHPFVVKKAYEGKDVADIFYDFHIKAADISEEECQKYGITLEDAEKIVSSIREFMLEIYNQKLNGTIFDIIKAFPKDAMIYNEKV